MNTKHINNHLELIEYHLSPRADSFLLGLHEDGYFSNTKFTELINAIKYLKKYSIKPCDIGNNFVSNLVEQLTYMYDILRDLFVHPNTLNISRDEYYEYILELKYETLALFNESIIEDYHGNIYRQ